MTPEAWTDWLFSQRRVELVAFVEVEVMGGVALTDLPDRRAVEAAVDIHAARAMSLYCVGEEMISPETFAARQDTDSFGTDLRNVARLSCFRTGGRLGPLDCMFRVLTPNAVLRLWGDAAAASRSVMYSRALFYPTRSLRLPHWLDEQPLLVGMPMPSALLSKLQQWAKLEAARNVAADRAEWAWKRGGQA